VPFDDGRGEHEPDPEPDVEPDPEADLPDYEEQLPSIPEPPEPDADVSDAPEGLVFSFWWLVLVFNAAIFALALGVLFLVVAGSLEWGRNLLFVGTVLSCYGLYRYWTNPYRDGVPVDDPDADESEGDATEDADGSERDELEETGESHENVPGNADAGESDGDSRKA